MDPRKATRTGIAIGVVAVVASAITIAAVLAWDSPDSEEILPLNVASWSVESHSYYPHYWINVSEDLRNARLYGLGGTEVTFALFNHSTGARELTASGGGRSSYGAITSITGTLSLQRFSAGVFDVHLYVNTTLGGGSEPTVEKRFHEAKEITLPAERPPVPQVTSVSVAFNSTTGLWHYKVEMSDPDADSDTLDVYLGDKGGFVRYHARANNSQNGTEWSYEADINVTLTHVQYTLTAQVTDKDGPYSTEWAVPIYP